MEMLQFVAVLSCSLFAGAAIYINAAEHPARLACGTELAATVFGPSYHRAAAMQASLAVIATITSVATAMNGGSGLWLVGAVLIFLVIPFTFIGIMPTNKELLDPERNRASDETLTLLKRWGRLHAVRSVLSTTAAILFTYLAVSA